MQSGTMMEFRRIQWKKNIWEAGYDGEYCVGSGNSIPEYVKLENYIAMIEPVIDINSKL